MNEDETHQIYVRGFSEGQNHSLPSKETRDFMKETRDNFKNFSNTLNELKIHIVEIKQDVKDTKEQAIKTNGRVNTHEKKLRQFEVEYEPVIKSIINSKNNNTQQLNSWKWELIKKGGYLIIQLAGMGVLFYLIQHL